MSNTNNSYNSKVDSLNKIFIFLDYMHRKKEKRLTGQQAKQIHINCCQSLVLYDHKYICFSQIGRISGGKICPSNVILKHDLRPILNEFQTFIKFLPNMVKG